MRRNLQRLMVVMAAMMICLGASAIDKVVKKVTLTGEVASVEDLQKADKFLLQNGENQLMLVALDGVGNYWDFNVATPATMIGNDGKHAGFFKLDKLSDQEHFRIEMYNINGSRRGYWGGDAYVNAQPGEDITKGTVIFGLDGQAPKYGQDGQDLALWDIEFDAAKGFAFKCVGRAIYISSDGKENARPSEAPVYWKAYTGYEAGFVAADVEAAVKAVESALKTSDAKAAFADAKAAYEADKEAEGALDKYAAAINAAIDVINACDAVKATFAGYKLSTFGTAAAKEVETKYNAGEYKDAAELSAAYVAAVKTQNAVGSDFTGAIVNPSFELGNMTGWTNSGAKKTQAQGNKAFDNVQGDFYCELWHQDGTIDMNQTITGLPAGEYELSAYVYAEPEDATLYANDKSTAVTTKASGLYKVNATVGESGELKIGATVTLTGSTWFCVDDFRLTLVKPANATVPEKDAWYTGADFFRFRADKNCTDATSEYYAFKDKVEPAWGAAAGEETNGCIVCKVPANVNPASQLWIRGTEAGKTIANGSKDGFKVTFRVKADGEYKGLESQAHNGWGYKTGGSPFGTLDVTTEWQTVSFICTGEKAKVDFTDLCFNLSGDTERTFYFDDVQISRGSEWYLNNEFHAKDYQDPTATYSDGANPHPAARFVSDAEGGYVEVISNANANQPYNSQLWIAIPEKYVGTSTKMTMEVQASKAIKCPENFQATATGNGWGCNPGPGSGVEFKVGEWTTVERILKTKGVKSTGTWRDRQADQYCLDLSENTGDKEAITYKFRNVKFEDAQEAWTETMAYRLKVTPFTYNEETGAYDKGADTNEAPTYDFGTGGEEGGYFKVTAAGKQAATHETQFFFQIADVAPSKELKNNEKVTLKFKIKALATETLAEGTEVTAGGGYHKSYDGAGWLPASSSAPATKFTVGQWTAIEQVIEVVDAATKCYSIDLSQDANPITYLIDDVEATWAEAPVLDWVELISNGDCEAAPEHVFAVSKETPVDGAALHQARVVAGVGKDGSKGIEFVAGAKTADPLDNQFWIYEPYALPSGTNIIVEFDYKADVAASSGSQSHNAPGAYLHWAAVGTPQYTTEWQHFKYEGKIPSECDGKDDDGNTVARFLSIAFNMSDFADPNKYYFDNFSFKVPAGTIDGIEPIYVDDLPVKEYIDPSTLEFTDNLFTNGDVEGEDMSAFIAKVNDDADALLLPAGTKSFKGSNQVLVKSAAREADPENEGKYLGNDHDTQFFVRLPYALPAGTTYFFSVDYLSNKVANIPSQTHGEPGQWKGNKGVGSIATGSDAQTLSGYFKAEADMRSIAFNLAAATEGGQFYFDNFVFKVVKDDEAAIKEFTATWDGTSTWNETFALNQAVDAGRTTETEGQGYTAESVQALTDAIAAGKAELANAEATKETLAAAAKAIEDAIAGLEKGGVIEDCDLTADMFFTWDAVDATASKTGQAGCAYDIEKSTGMPYGDGTVNEYNYADLTAYDHLAITATEGEPRLLFNRAAQDDHQGPLSVELPRDFGQNKFEAIVDNGDGSKTYVINLKAITEKDGYAHLHAIKGANWANTTVTAMKLFVGASEYSDVLTNINGVEDGASVKDGKYFINGQIVIVKNGVKYNAAGQVIQ